MAAPARKTPVQKSPIEAFEEAVVETPAPTIEDVIEEVTETAEQARIRELQAALAAEDEKPREDGVVVKPAPAITAEEKLIRELEDKLARKKAANITTAFEEALDDENAIHIHFVRDGLSAAGQVWYRGQEIVYDRRGEAYKSTLDKNGNSWVDLAGNTAAQYARFGDEFFRPGPFVPRKGEVFNDSLAAEDARRGTAAPITRL